MFTPIWGLITAAVLFIAAMVVCVRKSVGSGAGGLSALLAPILGLLGLLLLFLSPLLAKIKFNSPKKAAAAASTAHHSGFPWWILLLLLLLLLLIGIIWLIIRLLKGRGGPRGRGGSGTKKLPKRSKQRRYASTIK